jgi:hypothetical protein
VAIAAFFVIREAGRIGREPPPALFDADDAYDWVVEHLPDDVAATLTPDDVHRILEFQIEFLAGRRGSSNGGGDGSGSSRAIVVGGAEQVDYIVKRAAATGEAYLPEQVQGVVETQLSYLRAIGAIGPPAPPDEAGSPPRD